MIEEKVIYEFSGVTLNEEKLYKRVVLEKSITITEKQFDEAFIKWIQSSKGVTYSREALKKELGFKNEQGE